MRASISPYALAFMLTLAVPVHGAPTAMDALVDMKLQLVPDSTLPGIPVGFKVTLSNRGDHSVMLPGRLFLRVVPSDGEPFIARYGYFQRLTVVTWPESVPYPVTLSPGALVDAEFPVDTTLLGPEWFVDERLNRPGVFKLQLLSVSDDVNLYEAGTGVTGPTVMSDVATLTIRAPKGEDAAVWTRMQELGGEPGWNPEMYLTKGLAGFVWHEHPKSYYLHYVAPLLAVDTLEGTRALNAAIEIDPNGPRVGWLTITLAGAYSRLAKETAFVHGDAQRAATHAASARRLFDAALARAVAGELHERGLIGRSQVPDEGELRTLRAAGEKERAKSKRQR